MREEKRNANHAAIVSSKTKWEWRSLLQGSWGLWEYRWKPELKQGSPKNWFEKIMRKVGRHVEQEHCGRKRQCSYWDTKELCCMLGVPWGGTAEARDLSRSPSLSSFPVPFTDKLRHSLSRCMANLPNAQEGFWVGMHADAGLHVTTSHLWCCSWKEKTFCSGEHLCNWGLGKSLQMRMFNILSFPRSPTDGGRESPFPV